MIKMIAIVEKKFGLSRGGEIPWEFDEDRVMFQKLTQNSVVIMGRNTLFSHRNFPLKNRINCVITKILGPDKNSSVVKKETIPSVVRFKTLEEAIKTYPDAWIIGGAQLYNYALRHNLIDEAIITQVNREYEADKFLEVKYLKNFDRELLIKKEDFCIWKFRKHYF